MGVTGLATSAHKITVISVDTSAHTLSEVSATISSFRFVIAT